MGYFTLHSETPVDDAGGYYDVDDGIDFEGVRSWALGEPITARLPHPLRIPIYAIEDFRGEPSDLLDGYLCLMSVRLVEALLAAGVDNLQTFDALLVDENNGRTFTYRAVNVLGLVESADLHASTGSQIDDSPLEDTVFSGLVVDTKRAAERRMFRLAESTGDLVIHAVVKEHLEAFGGLTLRFERAG
ncbi:MAG: hypothetical protein MUE69_07595 [Myxococcota bacterium]|jgi:hypothetical protein|nr:hypothetical protein [Myxococcota bacterium]